MATGDKTYARDIADVIISRLSDGEYLFAIMRDPKMHTQFGDRWPAERTVRRWAMDDVNGFMSEYTRARSIGLDVLSERLAEVANTPQTGVKTEVSPLGTKTTTGDMVEHRRLVIDTHKWLLAKWHPEKFGDRNRVDVNDITDGEVAKRLVEARQRSGG